MMPNVVRTISSQNLKRPLDDTQVDISKLPECPSCKKGRLQQRTGKFGAFIGCTNYPSCRYTQPVNEVSQNASTNIEVPAESKQYLCPRCKKGYFVKQNMRGAYYMAM